MRRAVEFSSNVPIFMFSKDILCLCTFNYIFILTLNHPLSMNEIKVLCLTQYTVSAIVYLIYKL